MDGQKTDHAPNANEPAESGIDDSSEMKRLMAWIRANRRASVLIGTALATVLMGLGSLWSLVGDTVDGEGDDVSLRAALAALDTGDFGAVREIAEKLRNSRKLPSDMLGGPLYVQGAVAAYEADTLWGKNKWTRHVLAATYLEEARDRGLPAAHRVEGIYLLGRSLFRSHQLIRSRRVLLEAIEMAPDRKKDILQMLSQTYLQEINPKLHEAIRVTEQYLAEPRLSDDERNDGLLWKNQILFRLGDTAACRASLAKISDQARNRAEAIVVEGQLLMHEAEAIRKENPDADQATKKKINDHYRQALDHFRRAQGLDNASNTATRKALYLSGLCLAELNDLKSALDHLSKVRNLHADSAEAVAAGVAEAHLLKLLGRNTEALEAYERSVKAVASTQDFHSPWLSLEQFRRQMLDVYESYLESGQFEAAVRMTDIFAPLIRRDRSLQLAADARVAYAKSLAPEDDATSDSRDDESRRKARAQYRIAGRTFARLARLRIATREYPEDLWNSAQNLRRGQDYEGATAVYEEYLKNETRRWVPQGLLYLGESRLSLGNVDEALRALLRCIEEYPNDPATYRARIVAGDAYLEKGMSTEVELFLRENLESERLGPKSVEWRDSLFALGKLLHIAGQSGAAIPKLEEAVDRYPKAPQAIEAAYLIAEAHRHEALRPLTKLETVTIDANRAALISEIRQLSNNALKRYGEVQQQLNRKPENQITPLEKTILRNCYFARGAVHFELGRFDETAYEQAIRSYSTATNLYQHEPEVLEAFLQIAACYRRMKRPVEARGTLEQAKVVLNKMSEDADFEQTTNFSRAEWSVLLGQLVKLYEAA